MVRGGFEILLAVKHCNGVRGEKEAIFGGKIVLDVNTHGGEGSGGRPCGFIDGGDIGVPGPMAFCFSPGGPLDVPVFHRKIVAQPPSPMTSLVKMRMF